MFSDDRSNKPNHNCRETEKLNGVVPETFSADNVLLRRRYLRHLQSIRKAVFSEKTIHLREHPGRFMRYRAILVATFVLTACSTAQVRHSESQAVSPTLADTSQMQNASIDSVVQFLLASAATDFHDHGPIPVGFRDVRVGHFMNPHGQTLYLLCGQFLPAREEGKARWTPFATIKTSGYEQWLGTQATAFCQDSSVNWDTVSDLSSSLQNRLDSLR
jgi:hypothetical protein